MTQPREYDDAFLEREEEPDVFDKADKAYDDLKENSQC